MPFHLEDVGASLKCSFVCVWWRGVDVGVQVRACAFISVLIAYQFVEGPDLGKPCYISATGSQDVWLSQDMHIVPIILRHAGFSQRHK